MSLYKRQFFPYLSDRVIICVALDIPGPTKSGENIIKAYGLKQQLGGFCYHFWTKAVSKLDRYRRKGNPDPLMQITDTEQQKRILKAVKATESYVMLCSIAIGILQLICLRYEGKLQYPHSDICAHYHVKSCQK